MGTSIWKPTCVKTARPSLLAYLHFNSGEKGTEHSEAHHDQPPQDSPNNEATHRICAPKPQTLQSLHLDEDNGSDVNRQTIDEGAGQQIQCPQHGGQYTRQRELSNQWTKVSKAEVAVTEMDAKRLEEKGHAKGLPAPQSFDSPETPRGIDLIDHEAITPIDEDWVVVVDDNNPVSKIALFNC
jgi:hypothetical protein